MSQAGYAFRDTVEAAGRLGVMARLFEPTSADFLGLAHDAELAYDLGCGPGFTTRLMHRVVEPSRLIGLDASASFVALARREFPEFEFALQDVTSSGFPAGPADLLYCRMLLTHLANPAAVLDVWTGELKPGGLLLVDEVEAIETADPTFARYLEVAAALIASRHGRLYIGAELESLRPAGLHRQTSRGTRLSPPPHAVAAMFRLNLSVWRDSPDVSVPQAELDRLDAELYRIASQGGGPITWTMRQIAYRRE